MTDTTGKIHTTTNEQDYARAVAGKLDLWVPACGGKEEPFMARGHRLLYCFNPASGEHAYIDLDRDVALTADEAREILS